MPNIMLERSSNVKSFFNAPQRFPCGIKLPYNQSSVKPSPKHVVEPTPIRISAMTIAAGFECKEGIVLCADRQMSHGDAASLGGFSHYERKVFGAYGQHFTVIACGAGVDGDLIKPVVESFFENLQAMESDEDQLCFNQVKVILETTLKTIGADLNRVPEMELLTVAMFEDGRRAFLRTHNLITEFVENLEILGIGDMSLIRYVIDAVYRPEMTLVQLAALAAYIIWVAKKYCPQYCGGATDVWALKKGDLAWNEIDLPNVNKLEKIFEAGTKSSLVKVLDKGASISLFSDPIWH